MMTEQIAPKHSYTAFHQIEKLLECQQQQTDAPDEMLFIIIHQVKELWFKLAIHELERCIGHLMSSGGSDATTLLACKALSRVTAIHQVLLQSWRVLETLTPDEFETVRAQVGENAMSGFQSFQYRHLEYLLGLKSDTKVRQTEKGTATHKAVDVITSEGPHKRSAKIAERLHRARGMPSLYDAVLFHLSQHRHADGQFGRINLRKDYSASHVKQKAVLHSWELVYRRRDKFVPLYQMAEALVDLESSFRNWRFLHLSIVARMIGGGTGGSKSPGVPYLVEKSTELFAAPMFPELWDVRQKMFDPAGFDAENAGYRV